jgi:type IX secretion system PorP/SprF family membrane protein
MKTILIIFLVTAFGLRGLAQSKVNFSQRMATPSYFFPEFTGWHGGLQANLQYRNQWPGVPTNYTTYNACVDGYFDKIHSGIGINLGSDRAGSGIILTNNMELNLSPKLNTQNGITFMPALSGKITHQTIDWTQLTFSQPDPSIPTVPTSIYYASVGAGLGIVFKETFLAAHVHDINQPNQSFTAGSRSRLSRTYSFVAGRVFTYENIKVTPSVSYLNQGPFHLFTVSCNAQYKWIYIGGKYDYSGFAGIALGAELKERIRLSYSYDNNPLRLGGTRWGSHEMALRIWLFKDKTKKQFLSNLALM